MTCLWSHLLAHGWLWWLAVCAAVGSFVTVAVGLGYAIGMDRHIEGVGYIKKDGTVQRYRSPYQGGGSDEAR